MSLGKAIAEIRALREANERAEADLPDNRLRRFCEFMYEHGLTKGYGDPLDLPEDNDILYSRPDDYFEYQYSYVVELFHAYHEYLNSKGQ